MKNWSAALQLLIVGFYVPLSLLLPTGIGLFFDKKAAHTFPLFALIGLGIGTLIMVYGVCRMVRPFLREAKTETEQGKAFPPMVRLVNLLIARKKNKQEK